MDFIHRTPEGQILSAQDKRGGGEGVFVWVNVDPHVCGLDAGEPDVCTVVVEVRATALFEGLGGGVEEAQTCEVVVVVTATPGLGMRTGARRRTGLR
jgi:hypothetical protein